MPKIDKIKIIYIFLGALLAAIFLFFSYSRVFDEFEYSMLDFRYRARPDQPVKKDIVIIEVGDDSIEKIGKWPFPRNYHALLIKALDSAGVDTIVFDIFFSEEKEGDKAFADAVKESGRVYIPYVFELDREARDNSRVYATGYAAPLIETLKKVVKGSGFVNVEQDGDGKVRRIPPFIEYKGGYYPHLTFLVALYNMGYQFDQIKIIPGKKIVIAEDFVIPVEEDSSMLVDYPAEWGKAFRHYSYVDILQSYLSDVTGQEPTVDLNELAGTVCFIGLTATASSDAHPSPLETLYPGVGVHTSVYNSMMEKKFLSRIGRWWNILILAFMWVITGFVTIKSHKRFALLSILLVMAAFVFISMAFFWPFGIWIDVFYPLVTMGGIYGIFTFKKYVTEMQKRELIEKELDIATSIQQSFLPKEIPDIQGLEVNVSMLTAKQVGGDLYDIIQLGENKLGVMIGDVSGKGVPAALYMARVVSVFKTFAKEGIPAEVLKNVNDRLVTEGGSNLFVTLTYMVFDLETYKTEFAIGGHLPTLVIEPDGNVDLLDVREGMPLGLIEGDFSEGKKDYKPGSIFVLYTDGVTEAMNKRDEMFGQERIVKLARSLRGRSAKEVVDAVFQAVDDFAGKAKQHDDITVMVIKTGRKKRYIGEALGN
ncbi:MAG: CHASE2 domain-containing protein [Candidatus Omnitrophota bacterium]|nr:CHASE2 domain-containing protein [Candidatus Omnitrophota bacterium]